MAAVPGIQLTSQDETREHCPVPSKGVLGVTASPVRVTSQTQCGEIQEIVFRELDII